MGETNMGSKEDLLKQIEQLKKQIEGLNLDCSILLQENNTLISIVEKVDGKNPILKKLYSMQWHDEFLSIDQEEIEISKKKAIKPIIKPLLSYFDQKEKS
jgi:hypothetical protein